MVALISGHKDVRMHMRHTHLRAESIAARLQVATRCSPRNDQELRLDVGLCVGRPDAVWLIKYAARMRSKGRTQLWPDLRRGADDLLSSAYSKWFGRFKRAAGIANRRLVSHSFRH